MFYVSGETYKLSARIAMRQQGHFQRLLAMRGCGLALEEGGGELWKLVLRQVLIRESRLCGLRWRLNS